MSEIGIAIFAERGPVAAELVDDPSAQSGPEPEIGLPLGLRQPGTGQAIRLQVGHRATARGVNGERTEIIAKLGAQRAAVVHLVHTGEGGGPVIIDGLALFPAIVVIGLERDQDLIELSLVAHMQPAKRGVGAHLQSPQGQDLAILLHLVLRPGHAALNADVKSRGRKAPRGGIGRPVGAKTGK